MKTNSACRVLVVSSRHDWRHRLSPELIDSEWDLYFVTCANEGMDLLTKKQFDLIVVDDSLRDMEPPEFCLSITDLVSNKPSILVACDEAGRFTRLWEYCGVDLAGSRDDVSRSIKSAMQRIEACAKQ